MTETSSTEGDDEDDTQSALRGVIGSLDTQSALQRAMGSFDTQSALRGVIGSLDTQSALQRAIDGAGAALSRAPRFLYLPPNLAQLHDDLDAERVVAVGRTHGVALYLVPRTSVCRRLLTVPNDEVLEVLVEHEHEILADCEALLDLCVHAPDLSTFTGLAREALHAHGDGHAKAAQSLAATTLDSLLQTIYGDRWVKTVLGHARGDQPRQELTAEPLAHQLVHLPLWRAHERYRRPQGEEPRTEFFSRHATVHAADSGQLTRENSLLALMMLVSLLGWRNRL